MLLAGCGGASAVPPTTAPATTAAPSATRVTPAAPGLPGFQTIEIAVGGEVWPVALAETPEQRSRGLMGVTDLGGLRGMLFRWDRDVASGFWMKDTLIPLDIAFFAADGTLVDLLSMVPCVADPCPSYHPAGPYRAALEVPAGGFEGVAGLRLGP